MRRLGSRRFLQGLAKGARRSRKPEAAQTLPQVLAANADCAGCSAHLPLVLGQLLQKILSLAFFEAIFQCRLVHTDAVNAEPGRFAGSARLQTLRRPCRSSSDAGLEKESDSRVLLHPPPFECLVSGHFFGLRSGHMNQVTLEPLSAVALREFGLL